MTYARVAELISQVRNARFGEMVRWVEELIDTGIWRDFTTPEGTHFEFHEGEFDYFLAAMEIDPEVVKRAYIHAKDVGEADGEAAAAGRHHRTRKQRHRPARTEGDSRGVRRPRAPLPSGGDGERHARRPQSRAP